MIINTKRLLKILIFQPVLAEMFELEVNGVHALVSKMIINEELMASLDQPTQCIVMHRSVAVNYPYAHLVTTVA